MEKDINSKDQTYPSFFRKIRWSIGTFTLTMFALYWSIIYIAENELEVISLYRWLNSEATRYEHSYQQDGAKAMLPNTLEFDSYWSKEGVPSWLKPYQKIGFYETLKGQEDIHFIVTTHPSGEGLFYVVFKKDADDYLDEYEYRLHLFTILLGGMGLVVIFLFSMSFGKSIYLPLKIIQDKINSMEPGSHGLSFDIRTKYMETRDIEEKLLRSKEKIDCYFQREQNFSRFASHELRTPIMVFKSSAELLKKASTKPAFVLNVSERLLKTSKEMEMLTEAFLLLGKDEIESHRYAEHSLKDRLTKKLKHMSHIFVHQDINYTMDIKPSNSVVAPKVFIDIVMSNLIKNACVYGDGDGGIDITLSGDTLTIVNNLCDTNETSNSYGYGLDIVSRICECMGWQFETTDMDSKWRATLTFAPIR
jgi:signal transduction histidine kinase